MSAASLSGVASQEGNGPGTRGIIAIVAVVALVLIGGLVVVFKQ